MVLDPTWLFLSLITGGIGFVLMVYAKKEGRWPHLVAGAALSGSAFVATTAFWLITIGLVIGLGLWVAIRLDW